MAAPSSLDLTALPFHQKLSNALSPNGFLLITQHLPLSPSKIHTLVPRIQHQIHLHQQHIFGAGPYT